MTCQCDLAGFSLISYINNIIYYMISVQLVLCIKHRGKQLSRSCIDMFFQLKETNVVQFVCTHPLLIVSMCISFTPRLLVGPFTGGLMVDYIGFEWGAAVVGLFVFLTVICPIIFFVSLILC